MTRLLAISDLHLERDANRDRLETIGTHPDDWLVLAGDIVTHPDQLHGVLDVLARRFARILFTPGNHEFWSGREGQAGPALYEDYIGICRAHGCLTPEDPFARWPDEDGVHVVAPLFTFYDYSFAPDAVPAADRVAWAIGQDAHCLDELRIDPSPFDDFPSWCAERVNLTRARLDSALGDDRSLRSVLVSHFPLRRDFVRLGHNPAFAIWCGTRATETWPEDYRADVCVHGHLHMRARRTIGGVRMEEVSAGYPREWNASLGLNAYLREILVSNQIEGGPS